MALIFSCHESEPPLFHPAVKASQEMGYSTWVRGPANWPSSPCLQPLQVTLWEAPGPVSPGQASHLQGPEWESITGAGWEHKVGEQRRSMRGSRPVGAPMHGLTIYTHTHTSDSHLTPPFNSIITELKGSYANGGLGFAIWKAYDWKKMSDGLQWVLNMITLKMTTCFFIFIWVFIS